MIGALPIELIPDLLNLYQELIIGLLHLLENLSRKLVVGYCTRRIISLILLCFGILRYVGLSFGRRRSWTRPHPLDFNCYVSRHVLNLLLYFLGLPYFLLLRAVDFTIFLTKRSLGSICIVFGQICRVIQLILLWVVRQSGKSWI